MLLIAVGAGLYTGHPGMIAPGLLAGWGALGVGYGVGSIISVILPYTMPERMNAFSSAAPGQGGQAFAGSMVTMVTVGVLSLPFVLPAVLGLTWVCVLAPFYGLLVEVLGRRLGARIGFARMPELLIAVSRPT
jgi:ABC-2 type transport system permease protein